MAWSVTFSGESNATNADALVEAITREATARLRGVGLSYAGLRLSTRTVNLLDTLSEGD